MQKYTFLITSERHTILKAKKSFGQHFLKNPAIAKRISESLTFHEGYSQIIEVGPGKGILTQFMLEKQADFRAIEADHDMVVHLEKNAPEIFPFVICDDFLRVNLADVFEQPHFGLIGNFPYNISSQIVIKMLDNRFFIPEMVGMFQKEVAERIVAPPGNKTYGVLSVLTQAYYECEYLFTVDKGNFNPPPKVTSGVIRVKRRQNLELGCDDRLFRTVVKQAFGQRRKMLRNSLKSFNLETDRFQDSFFDQRPERLSVADFVELTKLVELKSKE